MTIYWQVRKKVKKRLWKDVHVMTSLHHRLWKDRSGKIKIKIKIGKFVSYCTIMKILQKHSYNKFFSLKFIYLTSRTLWLCSPPAVLQQLWKSAAFSHGVNEILIVDVIFKSFRFIFTVYFCHVPNHWYNPQLYCKIRLFWVSVRTKIVGTCSIAHFTSQVLI